jgi:SAP domain-containing new25
MLKQPKLSESMTVDEFDKGYWYAVEVKNFAKQIGIPSASALRKDELEPLIRHFLCTHRIKKPTRQKLTKSGIRDIERGLSLGLPVIAYTSNKETKDFIVKEALKIDPHLSRKSGARYRLNRWRENQIEKEIPITYRDLVNQYVRLNQFKGNFPQAPSGRYINFLSDFLRGEQGSTRAEAIAAWKELKKLDLPKNYRALKQYRSLRNV